jgi:membrane-bound lytic murein transglycosylase A
MKKNDFSPHTEYVMRLFLSYCFLSVMLVFMVALNLNCQRVKPLLPLLKPFQPLLICLSPDEHPSFMDTGDRDALMRTVKHQIKYFSQFEQPAYYSWGKNTISSDTLRMTLEKFLQILEDEEGDIDELLKTHFDIYQSIGENGKGAVTFTGYYLPQVEGSLEADEEYRYPLYRLPDNLIIKKSTPHGPKKAVRIERGNERLYYTRKQIDQEGVLRNKGCEIAYLKSPLDCYLLHVQGSGTLLLPDDTPMHLQFAGSNYLPYRSLREEMLKDGLLSPYNASMESIHTYFTEHPDKLQPYLNRNKRYTFFKIREGEAVGSLGVPLTPKRSIATDKRIFPSGGLSYLVTTVPVVNSSGKADKVIPWSRFVLNQDEGGAIRGPHRVDIFWGTGDHAKEIASHLNHPGKLYYLILKDATELENTR